MRLGEPYRRCSGISDVEVGHYYQNVLIENGEGAARYLDECREIFGDERASYQDAINRHFKSGAPENWHESFISGICDDDAPVGGLRRKFRPLPPHHRNHRHRTGIGADAGQDLVRFSMDRAIVPLRATPTNRSNGCSTTGNGCPPCSIGSMQQWEDSYCIRSTYRNRWSRNSVSLHKVIRGPRNSTCVPHERADHTYEHH